MHRFRSVAPRGRGSHRQSRQEDPLGDSALWVARHPTTSQSRYGQLAHRESGRPLDRALPIYVALLARLASLGAKQNVWTALPREVNSWWRQRSHMDIVGDRGTWRIVGDGCERARVAYAALDGDRLVYSFES